MSETEFEILMKRFDKVEANLNARLEVMQACKAELGKLKEAVQRRVDILNEPTQQFIREVLKSE